MPRDKDQKMRFNRAELGQIKALFAENDELLYAIRKVLLQAPLTEQEEVWVRSAVTKTTFPLIKKFFLPELDANAPLFQITDMYLGLGAEIKSLSPEGAWPFVRAKEIEIAYIAQQLEALEDVSKEHAPKIVLADLTKVPKTARKADEVDVWVNINARNYILSFVDSNVQQIQFLAGLKDETVEQTMERLRKDSTK